MRLAELTSCPIVTRLDAKGSVDESHPLCIGCVGVHGKPGLHAAARIIDASTLIVAFGVVDLYAVSDAQYKSNAHGLRWTLSSKHHVAVPSYAGACGFLGKRVPNDLVFGEPIEPVCAKPGEPTDAEVQVAHTAYIAALKTLFDEHKAGLGYGDRELLVA